MGEVRPGTPAGGDAAEFPVLSTDRLRLRAVQPDDGASFRALLSIPEVTRYSNWPESPDEDEGAKIVGKMAALFPNGHGCGWIIEDAASGDFVGAVRFNYFLKLWKCGGIGYELHPRFWGRGLMTEALLAVVACGHERFGLHRIEAWTLRGNDASDRVLRKAGFRFEGIQRQKGWFKGRFHDLRIFGWVAGVTPD